MAFIGMTPRDKINLVKALSHPLIIFLLDFSIKPVHDVKSVVTIHCEATMRFNPGTTDIRIESRYYTEETRTVEKFMEKKTALISTEVFEDVRRKDFLINTCQALVTLNKLFTRN